MTRGTSVWAEVPWNRLNLDCEHLDARHLSVEEFHDAGQRVGNKVRHEQQTQALRREVLETASQNSSTSVS